MKRFLSAIILVCISCTLLFCLTSCSNDIVGTWKGEWTYEGNDIEVSLSLDEDGNYVKMTYRNNSSIPDIEKGTYTFENSELILHTENSSRKTQYSYVDGKLENNGHYFIKE